MTENEMIIQMHWNNPEAISQSGVSSDAITVTFWDNELLQGKNGLSIEEGQTLVKSIIPQIDPEIADKVSGLGRSIGSMVAGIIGGSLFLAYMFRFDQTPFWLFFNIWQLLVHIPLLNLKIPGFVSAFWREELMIWTMRNNNVETWMNELSNVIPEERKAFNMLLEAAGYKSTLIVVNLGLILWVLLILLAMLPIALAVDSLCTV